ncbi:MAG TPA: hypothetical protein VJZ71_14020 [Phycisphaerae bacterium]|nr:hypothetical protein [Phycisphaerae bacterium]
MKSSRRYRAINQVVKARDPDLAPRCPECGYYLHGIADLRCPECGHRASFDEAHWASDASRMDRSAVLAERIAGVIGWVLLTVGVVFWILELRHRSDFRGFSFFRAGGLALVVTWAILSEYREVGEPRGMALLIIGALWFVFCFAFWYIG